MHQRGSCLKRVVGLKANQGRRQALTVRRELVHVVVPGTFHTQQLRLGNGALQSLAVVSGMSWHRTRLDWGR